MEQYKNIPISREGRYFNEYMDYEYKSEERIEFLKNKIRNAVPKDATVYLSSYEKMIGRVKIFGVIGVEMKLESLNNDL